MNVLIGLEESGGLLLQPVADAIQSLLDGATLGIGENAGPAKRPCLDSVDADLFCPKTAIEIDRATEIL